MVTTIIRVFGNDEDKAFDFLKQLDKSIDQYTCSARPSGKSCAIGEIPVAIGYLHDLIKLKVENAPSRSPFLGRHRLRDCCDVVVKDGPDPVNAKKLYDWMSARPPWTSSPDGTSSAQLEPPDRHLLLRR